MTRPRQLPDFANRFDDQAALGLGQDFRQRHRRCPLGRLWKLFTSLEQSSAPVRAEQQLLDIVTQLFHDNRIGLVSVGFDQRFVQLTNLVGLFRRNDHAHLQF